MAGNQAVGDGVPVEFARMSKSEIYDMMSKLKTFTEKEPEQARQILVQNPQLTKALFQSQIMLGMVPPPQQAPTIQPTPSQAPSLPVQPVQQANIQAPHVLPGQNGLQDQVNSSQPPIKQQSAPMMPIPSTSSAPVSLPPQSLPMPPHASQSLQQPMANVQSQAIAQSRAQSSQLFNFPSSQPPALQPPMGSSSSQLSQPLQTSDIQHLPPQPRPISMPPFTNQHHPQMGPPNMGIQHSGVPHLHHSQPMFHPGNRPPLGGGPSFQQGQPSMPSQPPPQSTYQPGGSRLGPDFNSQVGMSMQPERGSAWIPGLQDNTQGIRLPGPPPRAAGQMAQGPGQIPGQMGQGPGQMGQGNQPPVAAPAPPRPPLTPDMETALLQQVMSLTPDQINHLPPDQRTQVLQLQQALRRQ